MPWKSAVGQQFGAAIDALENAVRSCSDELWDDGSEPPALFWYSAYHCAFFLDLYLSKTAEGFSPPPPFTLSELDPSGVLPERTYSRDEVLAYLAYGRSKCSERVHALTEEEAASPSDHRGGTLTVFELLLYTMRHVQHHAAQLNLLLREKQGLSSPWVSRASKRALTPARYAAARAFLEDQGRPLEAARARARYDGAPRDVILEALAVYQNEDGGFGHALEPDVRAPESSAIGTSIAFRILQEVDVLRSGTMADRGVAWLRRALNPDGFGWRIVPPSAEASPHAPWWNQTGRDHGYDTYSLNPTAEILGILYERPDVFPADVTGRIADRVMRHLAPLQQLEMHDLLCCLRLLDAPGLPDAIRAPLQEQLGAFAQKAVVRGATQWEGYGLRPLQVVDRPSSPYLPAFRIEVERNLDYLIETQGADGSWLPTWSWGDAYPEVWPQACREWAGILTLQNLGILHRFGRIEGLPVAR